MNQFEVLGLLETGTVVSAKSISVFFRTRHSTAKRMLNKMMNINGMCKGYKKIEYSQKRVGGRNRYEVFWYNKRNNI